MRVGICNSRAIGSLPGTPTYPFLSLRITLPNRKCRKKIVHTVQIFLRISVLQIPALKWFQPFCSESGRLKWVVDLSVKNRSHKNVKNPSKYLPKTLFFSFSRPSGAFFFQSGRLKWVVDLSRKKANVFKTQVVDLSGWST